MIAAQSTHVIGLVLQNMGLDLSDRFLETYALPKTIEFEAELKALVFYKTENEPAVKHQM